MEFQPLKHKFIPATRQSSRAFTLVLLHGTGGDENDLLPLAGYFGNNVNVLSLRGNVSEHGMPRFFRRLSEGVFDVPDLHFRTHELVGFLETFAREHGIDAAKFVALGYSNGANIAGASLVLYPDFFAGAMLFRPMQPFAIEDPFVTMREQPILMTSGRFDPTIAISATQEWADILVESNFKVRYEALNAGHQLVQEDINLARDWFEQHFETTDAGV